MTTYPAGEPAAPPRSAPAEGELLGRILDRLERIEARLARLDAALEEAPKAIAVAVDSFDEVARKVGESGVDLDALVTNAVAAASRLGALLESREFVALMHSGVLDPETLAVIGRGAEALDDARKEPPGQMGLFGLLGALGDPDVRTTLHFLVRVAARFGHATRSHAGARRIGAGHGFTGEER